MQKLSTIASQIVSIPINDIDTDQIIPARYLKHIKRDGFGKYLFADWRYLSDGSPDPSFILNQPSTQGSSILLVGSNFGCGSSREHAPWALLGWGFQVVIAPSFADIFYNNALKIGLLPVTVDANTQRVLLKMVERDSQAILTIDLIHQLLILPDRQSKSFPLDPFVKHSFLNGLDNLDYLLSFTDQIASFEASHGKT
jgi:3-isopropylmalate/(R)-2-methylmalate dehydratase small subunit